MINAGWMPIRPNVRKWHSQSEFCLIDFTFWTNGWETVKLHEVSLLLPNQRRPFLSQWVTVIRWPGPTLGFSVVLKGSVTSLLDLLLHGCQCCCLATGTKGQVFIRCEPSLRVYVTLERYFKTLWYDINLSNNTAIHTTVNNSKWTDRKSVV